MPLLGCEFRIATRVKGPPRMDTAQPRARMTVQGVRASYDLLTVTVLLRQVGQEQHKSGRHQITVHLPAIRQVHRDDGDVSTFQADHHPVRDHPNRGTHFGTEFIWEGMEPHTTLRIEVQHATTHRGAGVWGRRQGQTVLHSQTTDNRPGDGPLDPDPTIGDHNEFDPSTSPSPTWRWSTFHSSPAYCCRQRRVY